MALEVGQTNHNFWCYENLLVIYPDQSLNNHNVENTICCCSVVLTTNTDALSRGCKPRKSCPNSGRLMISIMIFTAPKLFQNTKRVSVKRKNGHSIWYCGMIYKKTHSKNCIVQDFFALVSLHENFHSFAALSRQFFSFRFLWSGEYRLWYLLIVVLVCMTTVKHSDCDNIITIFFFFFICYSLLNSKHTTKGIYFLV